MRRADPDFRVGRGVVALLLFCALAIRILVPAGYMPSFSGGGVSLVLCSTAGSRSVEVDLGKGGAPSDAGVDLPCVFGAGHGGGLPVAGDGGLYLPTTYTPAILAHRAIADLTTHRLAAPPPPALAPPALA